MGGVEGFRLRDQLGPLLHEVLAVAAVERSVPELHGRLRGRLDPGKPARRADVWLRDPRPERTEHV
jgi:hypothetical protein